MKQPGEAWAHTAAAPLPFPQHLAPYWSLSGRGTHQTSRSRHSSVPSGSRKAPSLHTPSPAPSLMVYFFSKKLYYLSCISRLTYEGSSPQCSRGSLAGQGGCARTATALVRLQSPLLMLWQNWGNLLLLSSKIKQRTAIPPEKIKTILKFKDLF